MKSNVKKKNGSWYSSKRKKKLVMMCVICNMLFKRQKKKSWKFLTPVQKLVCPHPLSQSVWWGQKIGWKFWQLQYSPQKLCQSSLSLFANFFQFALKIIRDFLFLCLSLEPKQQGHQVYSWISPTRNDSKITLEC